MRARRFAAAVVLALAGISCAGAQEFSAFAGRTYAVEPDANSFAWLISYAQDLGEHFALSFAWQNEGHVPGHHRDGHSMQAWAKARPFSPQLMLAAGIGPYRYFDTAVVQSGGSHADDHGYGVLYSVSAAWRTQGRLLYEVRFNRVETNHSIDTSEVLLGVGYRLDQDAAPFAPASADASRSELTVFAGRTIVNSFESEQATAFSVEYKYAFRPALRASIAWLSEGDAELIQRNGLVVQGWYEPGFSGDRFTLGLGLGLYIAIDDHREDREGAFPNGVITLTTSYRVGRDWRARFSWNRVVSSYDRDTDVLMFGAGYRF